MRQKKSEGKKRVFHGFVSLNSKMIPYQKEKIENAICFFAQEHKRISGKALFQTFLYKYLAFVDFISIEKLGLAAFGLAYRAMKKGPVPPCIYNQRHNYKTSLFEFVDIGENKFVIKAKQVPNIDYFSKFEISLMKGLVNEYAPKWVDDIIEDSHTRIRAYSKTERNKVINYALTFDNDLLTKNEELLNQAERYFLTNSLFNSSSKCRSAR
jgi:hypothetical protein